MVGELSVPPGSSACECQWPEFCDGSGWMQCQDECACACGSWRECRGCNACRRAIKPYYEHAGITIYHGNCREILPALGTFDLLLTDPPYGIGREYASYRDTTENLDAIVRELFPLFLAASAVVGITPGITNVHRWPAPRWILAWFQLNAQNSRGFWGFNEWQPILVYGNDPYLSSGLGCRPDVITTTASPDGMSRWLRSNHPCPKPLPSWKKILARLSAKDTDRVIDPMMGTGTTLDAAKTLGRRAIGIEIEERYCEIAAERLAQEVLPFESAPKEPEQMLLLEVA